tara:strand:+ start:2347 stop:2595 length:249 start_codon:yes stop_codon:yes gene_type:complete
MKRPHAHPRSVEERRNEAIERQAYRDSLGSLQQIVRLDNRLGIGEGAKKERLRLLSQLAEQKANKKPLTNKQRRAAKKNKKH